MGSHGAPNKIGGKWALYDEKFIIPGPALEKSKYNTHKPLDWLQDIRD